MAARPERRGADPGAPSSKLRGAGDFPVEVGPLSFMFTPDDLAPFPEPAEPRSRYSIRDCRLLRALGWTCLAAAAPLALWAAEFVGADVLVRFGLVAVGVHTLLPLILPLFEPQIIGLPPAPHRPDQLELGGRYGAGALSLTLRMSIAESRLEPIVEVLHPPRASEKVALWRSRLTRVVMACMAFAGAGAWARHDQIEAGRRLFSDGLALALFIYVAGLGLYRVGYGLTKRRGNFVLVGAVQLAALAAVVAMANRFDLLGGWAEFYEFLRTH